MRHLIGSLLLGFVLLATGAVHAAPKPPEGCSLTGIITDHHGQPVADALIALAREGEGQAVIKTAASDPQGRFVLLRLTPGTYRLSAAAHGFQPLLGERAMVKPGQASQVRLMLRPAPDATTSGVNPVKYQNRRYRGLFNIAPAGGLAASPGGATTTALVDSDGYAVHTLVQLTPEMATSTFVRRDWAGRHTTFGGLLRYMTDHHHTLVRVVGGPVAEDGAPAARAGRAVLRHHTGVQAMDAWQVSEVLQLVYGVDYVHIGQGQADTWRPRVALHWQVRPGLQLHTAVTPDGQTSSGGVETGVETWVGAGAVLPSDDLLLRPAWAISPIQTPLAAHSLRTEVGAVWHPHPKVTVKAFAHHDRSGAPSVFSRLPGQFHGKVRGGSLVVAYRPHRRLAVVTAYAGGRASAVLPAGVMQPAADYHLVALAAETVLPKAETRLSLGYRATPRATVHALDPLVSHLPWTESGLSLAFVQLLPSWLTPPGRWEVVLEGRHLGSCRGDGAGASTLLSHWRHLRGGLRVRF